MKQFDRRSLIKATVGAAGAVALPSGSAAPRGKSGPKPTGEQLDRAVATPVLKLDGLKSPVIIESLTLLRSGSDYMVRVRSKDGAEGVSVANPPRPDYLDRIFKNLIAPFFVGKDARDLENLLWELYRRESNYKMYGLAFWSPQAWAEFAILDMLGRIVGKPMGELIGGVARREIPVYVASERRDTTPEQEVEYLHQLVEQSGSKALKFRVGGRMSRNADALPGRTEKLIPMVRKSFGDGFDIHADSNSSYDVPNAVRVGRLLEEIKAIYFEEPCQFDHFDEMKAVRDQLAIPVAAGEQEFSDWRFRWTVANRGLDIVQPDLFYYGGMIRSMRVARMANLAEMRTTVHISAGFGFVYMLQFASAAPRIGPYQEYKLGIEKYGAWFDPPIVVKAAKMLVPSGPGVGGQHNIPILIIVINNGYLGLIRQNQKYAYGYEHAVGLWYCKDGIYPDNVKLVEAFGGRGERVTDAKDLADAFARGLESKVPYLIDVIVEREAYCSMGCSIAAVREFA